jgi:WD40 repeat protein
MGVDLRLCGLQRTFLFLLLCLQIDDYLTTRHSAGPLLLPVPAYKSVLKRTLSVQQLVRNPFILRLFVDALPGMSEAERKAITRYSIYNVFVHQWFHKEVTNLPSERQEALGLVTGAVSMEQLLGRFELLAALLAGEMLKANMLEVVFEASGGAVWKATLDMAAEWVVEDAETAALELSARGGLSRADRKRAESAASATAWAAIDELRGTCPLRRSGDSLQFIHKSFWEYICARLILLAAGSEAPLDTRIARTVSVLSIPGRRIQTEPEVLYFLADRWHHVFAEDSDVGRARECLFAVVAGSAAGVHVEHGASANAATILNWMGEPMLRRSWDRVVLEGADLTRAVLCGSSMVGAKLRGCRLHQSILSDVNLRQADMSAVEFGERAPLTMHHHIPGLAISVALGFDPSSGRSVVAGGDWGGSVRVWDTCNSPSRPISELQTENRARVTSVALGVDPISRRLVVASGSDDMAIHLWDACSGMPIVQPFFGHTKPTMPRPANGSEPMQVLSVALAVNPSTGLLVLASGGGTDKAVRLWDVGSGRPVGRPLTGNMRSVTSVALGVDLDTNTLVVASGGDDRTVRLWDVGSGQPRFEPLTGHESRVTSVALCVDPMTGRLLLASSSMGSESTVRLWSVDCGQPVGKPIMMPGGGWGNFVALCQRGPADPKVWGLVMASGGGDILRLWDVVNGRPLSEPLVGHTDPVTSVALGLDTINGTLMVASGSLDSTVRLRGPSSWREVSEPIVGHSESVTSVALALDPTSMCLLMASGSEDYTVRLWDVGSGRPVGSPLIGHEDRVLCVALYMVPISGHLVVASGSSDKTLRLWDAWSGQPLSGPVTSHAHAVTSVALHEDPDARCLVIASCSLDMTVRLWRWELDKLELLCDPLTGFGKLVGSVALDVDPSTQHLLVAFGTWDGAVILFDVTTRTQMALRGYRGHLFSIALGVNPATGRLLVASGNGDGTVLLWDASSGHVLGEPLRGHTAPVTSLALGVDTRTRCLVAAGRGTDNSVRLWNAACDQRTGEPLTGGDYSTTVALGRDCNGCLVLATGRRDATARAWDVTVAPGASYALSKLRWSSRSIRQVLEIRGASFDGAVGLLDNEDNLNLLTYHELHGSPSCATLCDAP